jgi:hypothetical protein
MDFGTMKARLAKKIDHYKTIYKIANAGGKLAENFVFSVVSVLKEIKSDKIQDIISPYTAAYDFLSSIQENMLSIRFISDLGAFGYVQAIESEIYDSISELFESCVIGTINARWDEQKLKISKLDDIVFITSVSGRRGGCAYVHENDVNKARALIYDKLVQKYGKKIFIETVTSKDLSTHLKIFRDTSIDKNLHRYSAIDFVKRIVNTHNGSFALVLYGNPGTGKSTISRMLAEQLFESYVRFDVSGKFTLSNVIVSACRTFQPECVIIDDIDRSSMTSGEMLSLIDALKQQCKCIIASVNDLKSLGSAVRRPGRFDYELPVNGLEESIRRSVLGDELYECFNDAVYDWPIAYLLPLANAYKTMSEEDAMCVYFNLSRRWRADGGRKKRFSIGAVEEADDANELTPMV